MANDSDVHRKRVHRDVDVSGQEWGSDFIADLLKGYGFEIITFNPGASFRGLEESIVNYNDDDPEVIQVPHEGLSVSIAHGYAKATGEPSLCVLHNVVGTLHGAMGLFNAYIDRVPVFALSGTGPMRKSERRPLIDWIHTALLQGNLVRDYVKWDDQPWHVDGVADSFLRGLQIANTPPKGPVYVALDHDVQECPLEDPMELPDFEAYGTPSGMAADPSALDQAASLLVTAEQPVILVDQVGDAPESVQPLIELAETLGAPVFDLRWRRYNFPTSHPLSHTGMEIPANTDVVLALDVWSVDYGVTDSDSITRESDLLVDDDYALIDVGIHRAGSSSLVPDTYALKPTEVAIAADTALAIPSLLEAVQTHLGEDETRRDALEARASRLGDRGIDQRAEWRRIAKEKRSETPISPAALAAEIWEVIRDDEWVLVNGMLRGWAHRLWDVDEFDAYVGSHSGGGGVGYGIGAAIGGALAYRDTDRIPINLQPDGDLMFYLSALWTIGHYELPLFTVMHNNRSLYNSTNHRVRLADFRGRDDSLEQAFIGTGYDNPTPDYASIAEALGVQGYGPVEDPEDLRPTLEAAWEDVKRGKPVLVDVVCQPR